MTIRRTKMHKLVRVRFPTPQWVLACGLAEAPGVDGQSVWYGVTCPDCLSRKKELIAAVRKELKQMGREQVRGDQ